MGGGVIFPPVLFFSRGCWAEGVFTNNMCYRLAVAKYLDCVVLSIRNHIWFNFKNKSDRMEKKRNIFYGLYLYSLVSGFIYFQCFWLTLKFNALPLVSIMDIVRFSILPLVAILPFYLVLFVSIPTVHSFINITILNNNIYEKVSTNKIISFTTTFLLIGAATLLFMSTFNSIYSFSIGEMIFLAYSIFFLTIFKSNDLVNSINEILKINLSSGSLVLFIIVPASLLSFPALGGYRDGYLKSSNRTPNLIIRNSKNCKGNENTDYIYIATLGDRAITRSTLDSSICITEEKSFILEPVHINGILEELDILETRQLTEEQCLIDIQFVYENLEEFYGKGW